MIGSIGSPFGLKQRWEEFCDSAILCHGVRIGRKHTGFALRQTVKLQSIVFKHQKLVCQCFPSFVILDQDLELEGLSVLGGMKPFILYSGPGNLQTAQVCIFVISQILAIV